VSSPGEVGSPTVSSRMGTDVINSTILRNRHLRFTMPAGDPGLAALGDSLAATAYVPRLLLAWATAQRALAHRLVDGSPCGNTSPHSTLSAA
jgi:hypothetical protein